MIYKLTCKYCGHSWEAFSYNIAALKEKKCTRCDDRHIRIQEIDDTKIDTYVGSPPFPKKKVEENEYYF